MGSAPLDVEHLSQILGCDELRGYVLANLFQERGAEFDHDTKRDCLQEIF